MPIQQAYKEYLTIQDPAHVVFSNLPFRSGQQVEVVMLAMDDNLSAPVKDLQALLKNHTRIVSGTGNK